MSTILDEITANEGGLKNLGCKVGKSYATLSAFRCNNKDDFPKLSGKGLELALLAFQKDRKPLKFLSSENGILVKVEINEF